MNIQAHKIVVFVARPGSAGSHEFLQLQRQNTGYLDGTWQAVRGSIEAGETASAAALRELREETALQPSEFYRVASVETFYDLGSDSVWHSAAFLAIVPTNATITLNDEHDAMRWVAVTDVDAQFTWPSEKLLLAEIRRELLVDSLCKPLLRITF